MLAGAVVVPRQTYLSDNIPENCRWLEFLVVSEAESISANHRVCSPMSAQICIVAYHLPFCFFL
jgi:hypothetical protein